MDQKDEEEKFGPVKRLILGKIVTLEEAGCYTFLLSRGQRVLFKPELICRYVSELPQDKKRGELEREGKRIAQVEFSKPKNISSQAEYRFISWLI